MHSTKTSRPPVLFVSHGGGPWSYVDSLKPMYARTERELRMLPRRLAERPRAVLVVSAHWEASRFSISTASRPRMNYDYGGFPPHTYQISYPAPGDPMLAGRAQDLITAAGIEVLADPNKGFDHGVFVPLGLMYPAADMPIVMLSVKSDYDPQEHLALGRALAPLRDEGVLIIGSGLTYHNLRGLNRESPAAEVFTQYLNEAVALEDAPARDEKLLHWERAPQARTAHPREDHLMPLLVAAGAAGGDKGQILFSENVMKIPMTSYVFGEIKDPIHSPDTHQDLLTTSPG